MKNNRREFLQNAGLLTAFAAAGSSIPGYTALAKDDLFINMTEHQLPKLPYNFDALEPYIDAATVELHYSKHHQGYVNGMNKAEAAITEALGKKDFSLVDYWTQKLAFHGAGNYLHTLYWNSMSPDGGGEPEGKLSDSIKINFGSFDKFKMLFTSVSKSVEGSGWGMLAYRPADKKLLVLQVENHQKMTTWDIIPLMVIDVWEHAYYLKYRNKRADYINEWWNVVNWDNAGKMFSVHPQEENKD
ncbi:superoxide dismutase [Bacteroidota bacterium]